MKKWIIITGAAGGVGNVLTPYMVEQGYSILAFTRKQSLAPLEELKSRGLPVEPIVVDYTSEESITAAFTQARTHTSSIAGIIHLVGGSLLSKRIEDLSLAQFREVVAVNLDSSFLVVREGIRWMKTTGGGNMVLFGSTTGIEPSAKKMAYGVAKAGVHNLTLSVALEASAYGIICNTVAPSYILTPRHLDDIAAKARKKEVSEERIREELAAKNPMHGILETEELLPIVELLLTTRVIQGQVIRVDLGQVGI